MEPPDGMRLDDLARRAGVATTTVRLYQNKGLLAGPRLVGRTGYYDQSHVTRLALIGRLQEQGFSLAGIGRLLETWEEGRELADLVGVEQQLDVLLNRRHEVVLEPAELLARFPDGALTPDLIQRAASLGLVEATGDGRFRLPDQRFLDTGAALIALGVPADDVLTEWAHLSTVTYDLARRFIALFEAHLLPADWAQELDGARTSELASTLAQLRQICGQVLAAALDASIARHGSQRLAELVPAVDDDGHDAPSAHGVAASGPA